MMSSQDKQTYDDRLLTRYLLGALPVEDAERLDELCIADEEVATRLHALEDDLVDAYVRGEVSGEDLGHFESFYLLSPKRRQKVEFAAALLELEKRPAAVAAPAPAPATQESAVPTPKPREEAEEELVQPPRSSVRRPMFRWGFAFAAAVMLFAAGYLLLENLRLRKQMSETQAQQATLEQRDQELQKQLHDQRSANEESLKEIERLRQSQPNLGQLKTVSILLPPPTRGAARPPTIMLQPGTDLALLILVLESDDFPQYRAALRDSAANQVLWTSQNVQSAALGEKKAISISIPAGVLKQQNYVVELTGLPAHGIPEIIGSYPFHTVLK
ncbi:MAG TPA: hypothetical protein VI488_19835 [Candidatus Angelobacter sp.]